MTDKIIIIINKAKREKIREQYIEMGYGGIRYDDEEDILKIEYEITLKMRERTTGCRLL